MVFINFSVWPLVQFICLLQSTMASSTESKKKLVCYVTNYAQHRKGDGKFMPSDVDPNLCTHIILAFAKVEKNKLTPSNPADSEHGGIYEKVNQLKKSNPKLKTLLAVGGGSKERIRNIIEMSSSPSSRQEFIKSVTKTLNSFGFDGLDMDWEYPSNSKEKHNYTLLMQELRKTFDKKNTRFLLSAAVPAGFETINTGFDVPALSRSVDFLNLMTYDFHGPWDKHTGHNTPLYSSPNDTPYSKKLTVSNAASTWVHKGAPKDKIMIGMATYGRTFTLANPASSGVGAMAVSGGRPGLYTRKSGCLAYYEICQMLKNGAHYEWDKNTFVPYAVKGDQWIGYDNESSIRKKTAWLRENGYGGAMVWTMDFDDFKGNFSNTNFPLIKTIKSELRIDM